jgi:hypothetical protein
MVTFETTDKKLARRLRVAQFNARTATVKAGGSVVTGHVRSVLQNKASAPAQWTITIVPSVAKVEFHSLRPAPRFYLYAEELY